jgi:hypothetical protein
LAILIRLLGLEDTAAKSTAPNPFKDVPEWGDRIAAYAYSIGLTVGINEERTLFGSNNVATPQELAAFLLRILGYHESEGDFQFSQAREKAVEVELYKPSESEALGRDNVTLRAEAVISIADALLAKIKNSDSRLIDKLVEEKTISKEAAESFTRSIASLYAR